MVDITPVDIYRAAVSRRVDDVPRPGSLGLLAFFQRIGIHDCIIKHFDVHFFDSEFRLQHTVKVWTFNSLIGERCRVDMFCQSRYPALSILQ